MKDKYAKTKKYHKVRDTCHYTDQYRGALHNICKLKYSMYEQIIVIFHTTRKYYYHFNIKELAEELEGQFNYLRENTEKYIQVQERKITKIGKNVEKITKTRSYRLQFIDTAKFIASLLQNFENYLTERTQKTKCKYGHDNKNVKKLGLNMNIMGAVLNIQELKMI